MLTGVPRSTVVELVAPSDWEVVLRNGGGSFGSGRAVTWNVRDAVPPWPSSAVTVTLPEPVVPSGAERPRARSLLSVLMLAVVIVTGLSGTLLLPELGTD